MFIPTTLYNEYTLSTIDECRKANDKLTGNWIFRGQRNSDWRLTTSFERMIGKLCTDKKKYARIEAELIRDFQRRAHHYIQNLPATDSIIEWLALMQHFGAPTRLLDFTRSFYVGLFFAIEDLLAINSTYSSVWAINYKLLSKLAHDTLTEVREKYSDNEIAGKIVSAQNGKLGAWEQFCSFCMAQGDGCIFPQEDLFITLPVEPFLMNIRMSTQQGLFMLQNDISHTFEQNLFNMLTNEAISIYENHADKPGFLSKISMNFAEHPDGIRDNGLVIKFLIPTSIRKEIMKDLDHMNINHRTLFPGLDGFARSMSRSLEQLAEL